MISANSTGWIGIDIGTQSVKVAQLLRKGHEVRLVDMAVVPRPEAWSSELPPQRPLSTRSEVATARSVAARLRGKRAACCASTAVCATTTLPIDPDSGSPAQEELINWLPKNLQSVIDFCSADSPQSDKDEAIVCAMSEPWSIQLATDIDESGMFCEAIDALPLSLARATAIRTDAKPNTCIAAIDLGYTASTLVVARDGKPCFVRSLPRCSTRRLIEDLSSELRLDARDGERVLLQFGLDSNTDKSASRSTIDGVRKVLSFATRELVDEIKRTCIFLRTHQPNRTPSSICLFGGGACIPGMATALESELDVPVSAWRPEILLGDHDPASLPLYGTACALSTLGWENAR